MNRNTLKLHLVEGPVTHDFTLQCRICDHATLFEGVLGRPLDTFFWAHNFMVMALGSCVKWPLLCAIAISSTSDKRFIQPMPSLKKTI
jgi:hypothetical protein